MKTLIAALAMFLLTSCSGYHMVKKSNPFRQYEVETLAVPMFINHGHFVGASAPFTEEFLKTLYDIRGLSIVQNEKNADAILVGIIDSPQFRREAIRPGGLRLAKGAAPNAVGASRQDFYVAGTSLLQMELRIMIIKKPSSQELEFLTQELGKRVLPQNKLVFNETFPLSASYNKVILDDEATVVNGTQNAGIQRREVEKMAIQAAQTFKDMVLYAF